MSRRDWMTCSQSALRQALDRHTDKAGDCWEWRAYTRPAGYGQVGVPGHRIVVDTHRVSWVAHNGPIPDGLCVCHHCDNKKCVRPDHLFLGTNQDNVSDAVAKGIIARTRATGISSGAAKLTKEQVDAIRSRYIRGVHPARCTGGSSTELAREFGITRQYVGQLVRMEWRQSA